MLFRSPGNGHAVDGDDDRGPRRLRVGKSGDVNGDDVPLEMLNNDASPLPSSVAPGTAGAMAGADEGRGAVVGSIGSATMFSAELKLEVIKDLQVARVGRWK